MKIEDVPTIVLVASGKGGVGKTTIASDIARIANEHVESVGLIDADISTPNSLQVLGGEEVDVSGQRLSDGDSLIPPEVGGVQLVTQGFALPDDVPVLRGAEWRAEVVVDYTQNVEWADDTEVVVIDSPPGSGEELQTVAATLPVTDAVVVTTPHPSSIRDAKKTDEFFDQVGVDHQAVVNMASIPAQDITEHVLSGVDFTQVDQIGEARADDLEELVTESADDFTLFGFGGEPDVGLDCPTAAVLPYSDDFGKRKAAWGSAVYEILGIGDESDGENAEEEV